MNKVKEPAYRKEQREARAKLKAERKTVTHYGSALELGIQAFKRANPDANAKTIRQFKENAWKNFDARKVITRPEPSKFEAPRPHNYQLPEGLSNHQKLVMRQAIREQIKAAQGGQS